MTNFEKICNGTAEELAEMFLNASYCAECTHKDDKCGGKHCVGGIVAWLNKKVTPELTQTEKEICVGLKHLGYRYLARDNDGILRVFSCLPTKDGIEQEETLTWDNSFWGEAYGELYDDELFDFIKWEDNEPTSIDYLLKAEG